MDGRLHPDARARRSRRASCRPTWAFGAHVRALGGPARPAEIAALAEALAAVARVRGRPPLGGRRGAPLRIPDPERRARPNGGPVTTAVLSPPEPARRAPPRRRARRRRHRLACRACIYLASGTDRPLTRVVGGRDGVRQRRGHSSTTTSPGERTAFDVPLQLHGTPFQRRVWAELERIRYGETVTYVRELAARVGRPGAARAVGAAVARNPVSIVVPCHRVVGKRRDPHRLCGGPRPEAVAPRSGAPGDRRRGAGGRRG